MLHHSGTALANLLPPQVKTGEHLSNYYLKMIFWGLIYLGGALRADYKAQAEHNKTPLHTQ